MTIPGDAGGRGLARGDSVDNNPGSLHEMTIAGGQLSPASNRALRILKFEEVPAAAKGAAVLEMDGADFPLLQRGTSLFVFSHSLKSDYEFPVRSRREVT